MSATRNWLFALAGIALMIVLPNLLSSHQTHVAIQILLDRHGLAGS